jgi:AcrR family transcriptional regulator
MCAASYDCRTTPRSTGSMDRHIRKARRDELLAQIMELVLANGFTRTRTDDLASWLGCSKATLYGIAVGKVPLVAAVLRKFLGDAVKLAEQNIVGITDPAARVRAYLTVIGMETRRISPACYRDMMDYDLTSDVYRGHAEAMAGKLREQIRDGVRVGGFRPLHPEFLAEAVNLIAHANQDGQLPSRAGLTLADAQGHLTDLVVATLTNTAYQHRSWPEPADRNRSECPRCTGRKS